MGQGMALSRNARGAGAALCGAMAALVVAALVRDLSEFGAEDVFWNWREGGLGFFGGELAITSLADVQLLVLFLAGIAVARTAAAGAYLLTLGVLTVVLRLVPALALLTADRYEHIWDFESGKWIVVVTVSGLVLGALLLLTAAVGRAPAWSGSEAVARPALPRPGPGVGAMLFLIVTAGVLASWQLYWLWKLEGDGYERLISGEGTVRAAAEPPVAVWEWTLCVLCVVGAAAVATRAGRGRSVGLAAGWMVLGLGAMDIALYAKYDAVFDFEGVSTPGKLAQFTGFYEVIAGLLLLGLLAAPGLPREPSPTGWGQQPPWQPQAQPWQQQGPGWGQAGAPQPYQQQPHQQQPYQQAPYQQQPYQPAYQQPDWQQSADQPDWQQQPPAPPAHPPSYPPAQGGGYGPPPQDGRQGW